ncbi:MAG: hypothetical protein MJ192_00415 [Clostridia bacterium]|nr:hypothetical protein [Clostridia bacterium]
MDANKRSAQRRVIRLYGLGAAFLLVCLVYVIRLGVLQLNSENIRGHKQDGTTTRTEIVQAVRGEIYDRNGTPIVTNRYVYDLTFDYAVMPKDMITFDRAILDALSIVTSRGEAGRLCNDRYPFEGVYPYLEYSVGVGLPDTKERATLAAVLESTGVRATAIKRIRVNKGVGRDKAEAMFDADPLQYVTAQQLTAYFEDKYELTAEVDGERVFSDEQIDRLLRVLWGMAATGFSKANDYILASDVSMDTITCVREWGVPGSSFRLTAKRVYAYPGYASHILGQTGPIYAEDWPAYKELGYNMNATVGISGVEAAFESILHGQDGIRVIVEDRSGRIVDEYWKTEPVAGQDVYLTIDIDVQIAAENALAENVNYIRSSFNRTDCKSGAAVAVDPKTGEILAIASYPTYDLSTFNEQYNSLAANDALPLYNRALSGQYAPGSTFKPGVAVAAMTEGVLTPDTLLDCDGVYTYYQSYQPDCWIYNSTTSAVHKHGAITVREAVRVSCNCFFYETGRRLGITLMNRYCKLYGLGEHTGIELPESTGILAGPAYRELSHGVDWQPTDTIAAAIGQSENVFTPLQLGMYISTIVNGGTRYEAHLLSRVRDFTTRQDVLVKAPAVVDSMQIDQVYLNEIITGMEQVVTDTASISRYLTNVPVTVAGKTGTAQTGGKLTDNGLFVCCAPSRDPDIVVVSVIERAGGGSYAAMTSCRILEAYYQKPRARNGYGM